MAREQSATFKVATDDLLSVGKAAKALGTSRWSVYRWIDTGKILSIRLGGILFVPRSEIERIKSNQAAD